MSVCCIYLCPTCFSINFHSMLCASSSPPPSACLFSIFSVLFCSAGNLSTFLIFLWAYCALFQLDFPLQTGSIVPLPRRGAYVLPVSVCIAFSSLPRHSLPVRPSPSQVRCPPRQPTPWRKLYVLIFNGKLLSHCSLWRRQSRAEPHRVELLSRAIQTVNFNDTLEAIV